MWDKVKLTRPSFRDLLWLFAQVLKASPFIAAVWITLVLINAGAGAAQLLVLRETVNTLVDADLINSAVPWLVALCCLFFVEQAISTFLPLLREQLRIRAGFTLQREALQKTGKLPLEAFDDEESHNLINRVVTGGDSSVVQLMQNGLNFIEYTPVLLISAVVLGLISVWIPLIIIGGAILLRVFEIRMGARMRHFEVENTRNKRLADYYVQLLTERRSAAEIRLWGIGETLLQRWRTILAQYLRERLGIDFQNASQGIFPGVYFRSHHRWGTARYIAFTGKGRSRTRRFGVRGTPEYHCRDELHAVFRHRVCPTRWLRRRPSLSIRKERGGRRSRHTNVVSAPDA